MQPDIPSGTSPAFYLGDYDPSLNGLGGWFALVILGQFVTLLSGIYIVVLFASQWGASIGYNIMLGLLLAFSFIVYILGSILVLYRMFSRKIQFRKLFVIQSVLSVVIYAVLLLLRGSNQNASLDWDFWRTLLWSVIWITYLYKSRRVSNTFIYPFRNSKTNLNA